MPEIETCAPRLPSRNSALRNSGSPSRPTPIGIRLSIWSKYRAAARSSPAARCTSAPGEGGTYTSGSTRVVVISADSWTWAGRVPSEMANTSDSNAAPSCRARTWVTIPAMETGSRPGTSRWVTTTSSSCRYAPGVTATQNCSGVASVVPSTRPTGSFIDFSPSIACTYRMPSCRTCATGAYRPAVRPSTVEPHYRAKHCEMSALAYVAQQQGVPGGEGVRQPHGPDRPVRDPGDDPAGARAGAQRGHR